MNLASPDQAAREFLDTCANIEQVLKHRHKLEHLHGLGAVVRDVESHDPVVRRYEPDLRVIAELRNVISHNAYQGGAPIAVPLASTIDLAGRILNEIRHPVTVAEAMSGPPMSARPTDPLRDKLIAMVGRSFSQIPVCDDDGHLAMLTTNAVARWVAHNLDKAGDALVEGATVADVVAHLEPTEQAKFVGRRTPLTVALETLTAASPPIALLVTDSGKKSETPLGMLVAADVPRMTALLDLRDGR